MRELNPRMAEKLGAIVNRAVQVKTEGTARPFVLGHLITNRCMCRCPSCLWRHNDWEDVPADDIKRFYAEAAEEGFLGTAISGGEPFLRKDLGAPLGFGFFVKNTRFVLVIIAVLKCVCGQQQLAGTEMHLKHHFSHTEMPLIV